MNKVRKYFFLLLFPIVLVLPLPLIFSSLALVLALMNLLIIALVEKTPSWSDFLTVKGMAFILFGFFIVNVDWVVGSLRAREFTFFVNEQRIAFFLVPLIFYIGRHHLQKIKGSIMSALVLGVILHIIYIFVALVYFYSFDTNRAFQFNHYLKYDITTNVLGSYHHTYIGLYMTFALVIVLKRLKNRPTGLLLSFILLLSQLVIGSKLTFFLSLIFVFYVITRKSILKLKSIWINVSVLIFTILLIVFAAFQGLFNTLNFSLSNRLTSWSCSLQIFWENRWLGVSKENALQFLESCIENNAISTHSQILSELVYYGIFGLWFLGYFIFLHRSSTRKYLFKILIWLIFLVSLFENVFSLQRGILFFTFFASLLLYANPLKNEKSMPSNLGS